MATTAQIAQNVGLREKIDARGMTQQQVAKKGKMSPWTVNLACKGEMTEETRAKLASILDFKPEEIGQVTKESSRRNAKKREELEQTETKELKSLGTVFVKDMASEKTEGETIEIPASFDAEDGDILAAALFRTRKSKGFSEEEVDVLKKWATSVVDNAKQLRNLLIGNLVEVDVLDGEAVFQAAESVPKQAPKHAKPSANKTTSLLDLDGLISAYLKWGSSEWGKPYLKEKGYLIPAMAQRLALKSLSDLTSSRFESTVKKMGKSLTFGTIMKNVKHFGQFVSWAVERAYLSENPLQNEENDYLTASHIRSLI